MRAAKNPSSASTFIALPPLQLLRKSPRRSSLASVSGSFWAIVLMGISVVVQFEIHGVGLESDLWETVGMKKPELTDVGWLGPRDEMDRASHRFGRCSECHEIICVEKAVTDTPNTKKEKHEMLHKEFSAHLE